MDCNKTRPHTSLGFMTSAEAEERYYAMLDETPIAA